jgi:type II secretory pathway pseudopilin PulG
MVEIAISLAVIGFALVAIIGVLPFGMRVQKVNREETIINQDANVFMDAIRNGAQGLDDLTNYVLTITNYVTHYHPNGTPFYPGWYYGYTRTNSYGTSLQYPLINGSRIVGLLSTPQYVPLVPGPGVAAGEFLSNHVVAYVRSMSGSASQMPPQNDPAMQDFAFTYRMTSEVVPIGTNYYDPTWTVDPNYVKLINNLNANLHDVRLYFGWPPQAQGRSSQSGQSFRTLAGGLLLETNEPSFGAIEYNLYFFQPQTYVKAP